MSSTGDEVDWIHNGDDLCFHGTWAEKKEADRLRESVSKQNARRHPDPEAEEREKEERERKEVYRTLRQREKEAIRKQAKEETENRKAKLRQQFDEGKEERRRVREERRRDLEEAGPVNTQEEFDVPQQPFEVPQQPFEIRRSRMVQYFDGNECGPGSHQQLGNITMPRTSHREARAKRHPSPPPPRRECSPSSSEGTLARLKRWNPFRAGKRGNEPSATVVKERKRNPY